MRLEILLFLIWILSIHSLPVKIPGVPIINEISVFVGDYFTDDSVEIFNQWETKTISNLSLYVIDQNKNIWEKRLNEINPKSFVWIHTELSLTKSHRLFLIAG